MTDTRIQNHVLEEKDEGCYSSGRSHEEIGREFQAEYGGTVEEAGEVVLLCSRNGLYSRHLADPLPGAERFEQAHVTFSQIAKHCPDYFSWVARSGEDAAPSHTKEELNFLAEKLGIEPEKVEKYAAPRPGDFIEGVIKRVRIAEGLALG